MANCAVVQSSDGLVINTIVADVTDPAPDGCYLVEMTPDNYGGPGWTWDGTHFIAPGDTSGSN